MFTCNGLFVGVSYAIGCRSAMHVFIHQPGIYYSDTPLPGRVSLLEDYSEFLTKVFEREGIVPKDSVFWFSQSVTFLSRNETLQHCYDT